ncbi:MAG TPA: hypothetical protein VK524_22860 [Polyangiaceae bacterium]|nr:hypothetical protein [Polyangiaceae bacterium]
MRRLALVLLVSTLAVPAFGKGGPAVKSRVAVASVVVQRSGPGFPVGREEADSLTDQRLISSVDLGLAAEAAVSAAAPIVVSGIAPKAAKAKPPIDYKAVLDDLIITRDLQIPGAPTMAVRLIPTSTALAGGEISPIVLTPRVVGSSWYGLDVAARF